MHVLDFHLWGKLGVFFQFDQCQIMDPFLRELLPRKSRWRWQVDLWNLYSLGLLRLAGMERCKEKTYDCSTHSLLCRPRTTVRRLGSFVTSPSLAHPLLSLASGALVQWAAVSTWRLSIDWCIKRYRKSIHNRCSGLIKTLWYHLIFDLIVWRLTILLIFGHYQTDLIRTSLIWGDEVC